MDRMAEPLPGFYPTHPEWDWFWESVLLCPDFISQPPRDMGGWCHSPFQAIPIMGGGLQSHNRYGPASYMNNDPVALVSSIGWQFLDTPALDRTGTHKGISPWTLALVWNCRNLQVGFLQIMSIVTGYLGVGFTLSYDVTLNEYTWTITPGPVQQDFPCLLTGGSRVNDQVIVISSLTNQEVRVYSAGRLVANWIPFTAPCYGLYKVAQVRVSYTPLLKQVDVIGGDVGPLILSRSAWSEAQAQQWSADPWGFMRPAVQPIPYTIGCPDGLLTTELAADGQLSSDIAADGDVSTGLASDGQLSTELAADGVLSTELAADGDLSACQRGHPE